MLNLASLTEMRAPFKAVLLNLLNLFWVRDAFENLMKTMGSSPGKMHVTLTHTHMHMPTQFCIKVQIFMAISKTHLWTLS